MTEPIPSVQINALAQIWDLTCQARATSSDRELGFLLVNQTRALTEYRQSVLWLRDEGVYTLSGVVQMEANAPYVLWVDRVARHLAGTWPDAACIVTSKDLPEALSQEWAEWWPENLLWLPHGLNASESKGCSGGSLWLRDAPWADQDLALMQPWSQAWWHAFSALHKTRIKTWAALKERVQHVLRRVPNLPWYRQRQYQLLLLVITVLLFPVRLSVLAPGELVAAHPVMVRSPLDAVIEGFQVQPNQKVTKGQPLFMFDQTLIRSRVEVAQQALVTAEAEYRQTYQQALSDSKAKAQLALLAGKIEEKRAEFSFASEQQQRASVLAPQDGWVLMDDPSEWIGRPVSVGERILRLASPDDVEVEVWLPIADAIALPDQANVSLYLNASPLAPVSAHLRYLAHDAVQRPDGSYAYRLRATLTEPTDHRVGLKGTARVHGHWVPLSYWLLRRPWAALRSTLGV